MFSIKKIVTIFILSLSLSSCGTISPLNDFRSETFDFPPIDKKMTMTLGDSLVSIGFKKVGEGMILNQDIEISNIAKVRKGSRFLFTIFRDDNCYGIFEYVINGKISESGLDSSGLAVCIPKQITNKINSYLISCPSISPGEYVCVDPLGDDKVFLDYKIVNDMEVINDDADSFRQEFIYNGKVDNNIKFIYREFSSNMNRFAFQQDVQYDLNESNIIGFKELEIEIIEATNQSITYRVLRNFIPKNIN